MFIRLISERRQSMDNGASSYHRFLEGNEDGIIEIIKNYKDGLILYINGFVQNIHVAEELAEEVFIKLVVKRPKFHEKSTFKTWLYSIGRNVAKDFLRHSIRYSTVPIDNCEYLIHEEESLEELYLREERKIIVHRALSKLKLEYRQVLYLTFFEGFNNSQVAIIMKKNTRQIENLIYRAKLALKSELVKEGIVNEEL